MDPEDLREVISAYQNCVAETVGRLGGFIAKFMGDGVLVYFGYPALVEGKERRGSIVLLIRRTGHRQISIDCCADRTMVALRANCDALACVVDATRATRRRPMAQVVCRSQSERWSF